MNAIFPRKTTRITVDRYQKMVETGVLTKNDRIELIDGEMIDMAPIGAAHAAVTARLNRLLVEALGARAVVSPGGPLNLGDHSEPQPDLLALKPRADFYESNIPEARDVLLLVEVADSTLAFDEGVKLALYAQHGIEEYWIADVAGKTLRVYLAPRGAAYAQRRDHAAGDGVSLRALPQLRLVVAEIFSQ